MTLNSSPTVASVFASPFVILAFSYTPLIQTRMGTMTMKILIWTACRKTRKKKKQKDMKGAGTILSSYED